MPYQVQIFKFKVQTIIGNLKDTTCYSKGKNTHLSAVCISLTAGSCSLACTSYIKQHTYGSRIPNNNKFTCLHNNISNINHPQRATSHIRLDFSEVLFPIRIPRVGNNPSTKQPLSSALIHECKNELSLNILGNDLLQSRILQQQNVHLLVSLQKANM